MTQKKLTKKQEENKLYSKAANALSEQGNTVMFGEKIYKVFEPTLGMLDMVTARQLQIDEEDLNNLSPQTFASFYQKYNSIVLQIAAIYTLGIECRDNDKLLSRSIEISNSATIMQLLAFLFIVKDLNNIDFFITAIKSVVSNPVMTQKNEMVA